MRSERVWGKLQGVCVGGKSSHGKYNESGWKWGMQQALDTNRQLPSGRVSDAVPVAPASNSQS